MESELVAQLVESSRLLRNRIDRRAKDPIISTVCRQSIASDVLQANGVDTLQ